MACLLGPDVEALCDGPVITAVTLEDAAGAIIALLHGEPWPHTPAPPAPAAPERVESIRQALAPGPRVIRGLYAGGTLAEEARLILARLYRSAARHPVGDLGAGYEVIDLGADEYTRGRAHPMLDPTTRIAEIARAGTDPATAVILLDVVLGYGAAADPAGDVAPALAAARAAAQARGSDLAVVACVVGTAADPQGLDRQVARLEHAGAWVLPSNAQAARAAAWLALGPQPPAWGPSRERRSRVRPAGRDVSEALSQVPALLSGELRVINLGLEGFAADLERRGVTALHVAWQPPAGGDLRLAALLASLDDEGVDGTGAP